MVRLCREEGSGAAGGGGSGVWTPDQGHCVRVDRIYTRAGCQQISISSTKNVPNF